jgi:hypothetical protein
MVTVQSFPSMNAPARRLVSLRAALGFLCVPPNEPELCLLHRWLDTWTGLALITVGVERQSLRLSLSPSLRAY